MSTKYVHTNIVSIDINKLAKFYIDTFDCKQQGRESEMMGDWVDKGTGVKNAKLKSIILQLPGYENGPTLEIFQYSEILEGEALPKANIKGIGHLAFSVDNVEEMLNKAIQNGGNKLGELVTKEFKSGVLIYIYITDPEGNIIEIQSWKGK
jgi:predicted enzyme related to lactoylglutathione lyase